MNSSRLFIFFPEEKKKEESSQLITQQIGETPPPIDEVRLHRMKNGSPAHDRHPAPGIDFVASFFLPRLPLKFISSSSSRNITIKTTFLLNIDGQTTNNVSFSIVFTRFNPTVVVVVVLYGTGIRPNSTR